MCCIIFIHPCPCCSFLGQQQSHSLTLLMHHFLLEEDQHVLLDHPRGQPLMPSQQHMHPTNGCRRVVLVQLLSSSHDVMIMSFFILCKTKFHYSSKNYKKIIRAATNQLSALFIGLTAFVLAPLWRGGRKNASTRRRVA